MKQTDRREVHEKQKGGGGREHYNWLEGVYVLIFK